MLESAQQTKKIDLKCYVINDQWFRVADIILPSGHFIRILIKK